jgi:hypothetical protein
MNLGRNLGKIYSMILLQKLEAVSMMLSVEEKKFFFYYSVKSIELQIKKIQA